MTPMAMKMPPMMSAPNTFTWDSPNVSPMLIADISSGNTGTADVFFLVALILFAVYALIGFARTLDARIPALLLGAGLACLSLALLVL